MDLSFPVFGDFSDWDGGGNRSVSKNQYQTTKNQGTLLDLKKKLSRITFWESNKNKSGVEKYMGFWDFGSVDRP